MTATLLGIDKQVYAHFHVTSIQMIRFDMREERPVVQEVEKDNTKNDDKSIHEQMLNGHI